MRGESWGPLHGLPVTIKDAIATAGIRSTGGATQLRDNIPTSDAPAVVSLKAAGAIVFGKTNVPEWSGDFQSFNEMFGTTNNPWDLARTPGGSSGGAAAAVACGMTSFELGTDIGGSVRVPSAFCGVYGHKPSWGLIPTFGYIDEPLSCDTVGGVESDINVFGPIARGVGDLALLVEVLARPIAQALPPTLQSLAGLRVAAWIDEPALLIDKEMSTILRGAIACGLGSNASSTWSTAVNPSAVVSSKRTCTSNCSGASTARASRSNRPSSRTCSSRCARP